MNLILSVCCCTLNQCLMTIWRVSLWLTGNKKCLQNYPVKKDVLWMINSICSSTTVNTHGSLSNSLKTLRLFKTFVREASFSVGVYSSSVTVVLDGVWNEVLHPCPLSRYSSYQSEEDAKERRHSHTIGGLSETECPPQLPSPSSVSLSSTGKGPFTSLGQSWAGASPCRWIKLLHDAHAVCLGLGKMFSQRSSGFFISFLQALDTSSSKRIAITYES